MLVFSGSMSYQGVYHFGVIWILKLFLSAFCLPKISSKEDFLDDFFRNKRPAMTLSRNKTDDIVNASELTLVTFTFLV